MIKYIAPVQCNQIVKVTFIARNAVKTHWKLLDAQSIFIGSVIDLSPLTIRLDDEDIEVENSPELEVEVTPVLPYILSKDKQLDEFGQWLIGKKKPLCSVNNTIHLAIAREAFEAGRNMEKNTFFDAFRDVLKNTCEETKSTFIEENIDDLDFLEEFQ